MLAFPSVLRLGILHCPTRIPILLGKLGRLVPPIVRDITSLDRVFLVLAVVLLGRLDAYGINDLTTFGQARPGEMLVETGERMSMAQARTRFFTKARSSRHRNLVGKAEPEKPHE